MSIISVQNLSKNFRVIQRDSGFLGALKSLLVRKTVPIEAVKNISFTIEEGELVGFVGPNGAGKTTTLKMISGLLYPTNGQAQTLGSIPQKREKSFLREIALVMGNRSQLWWEIPVEESLKLNKEIYELDDAFYKHSLGELVELLEIAEILKTPVKKLSLGQRMKAELCAALLHKPKLLLLDEPTLGLDVLMQKKMRQFLSEYNTKNKATILLTSHNMDDVAELCERILIIDHGVLIYDGSLRKVIQQYAPTKRVSIDFEKPPNPEVLREFWLSIRDTNLLAAQANIKREEISKFTARLLNNAGGQLPPILDLSIEEPPIEEVIRKIFENKDRHLF